VERLQVLQYTRSRKHIFPLFFSNISTVLMFWTFVKAFWRSLIAKTRFGNITFKTTLKVSDRNRACIKHAHGATQGWCHPGVVQVVSAHTLIRQSVAGAQLLAA
jgi:hypothetical protein